MEKTKNNTLIQIFLFTLLIILSLSITTSFGNVLAEGSTDLNESTATVKVVFNDETNYYSSIYDAVSNLPKNTNPTIVILKDTSMCSVTNIKCSIDLNGNILSGQSANINYSTITILDSKGSGKLSGSIACYSRSSNVTINSAGLIDTIILTDNCKCTILGGKINTINANGSDLNISGGEINTLWIYNYNIHLSGGTINNFSFVGNLDKNFAFLNEGYIYTNKANNLPIKTTDMTPSTQVTIIKCPHSAFTDNVCDYCDFICEHSGHYNEDGVCQVCGYICTHENHFNSDGICDICNYVCPHLELNDDKVCLKCGQSMEVYLRNETTTKNYIKITDAISAIKPGDTLSLYKNIILDNSLSINEVCTIDLNGYILNGESPNYIFVKLNNKITVTDSKGNGNIAITTDNGNSLIELKGAQTTTFLVMIDAVCLKFYSGRLLFANIYGGTLNDILPNGHIFVKHNGGNALKLTKQETNIDYYYDTDCYLTCEECTHNIVDENLKCKYCGAVLSQDQIMQALYNELQETKEELTQAIAQKEDISSINETIKTLNNTISNTETICKAYSDEKDEVLKTELQNLIANSKQEAISSSNTALELAKNNLLNLVNNKLDIETYNQKVEELNTAINNAKIASEAYADSQDSALKNELINAINESKITLENVNNAMLERLSKAEAQINNNAKSINSLKTALVVVSISIIVIISIGFVLLYLYIKKRHIR